MLSVIQLKQLIIMEHVNYYMHLTVKLKIYFATSLGWDLL